ncbi:protein trichome birefringence-like 42 [Solanum pennellii]|uniref:Protein trichome birefringence-like 42 n=1 Tax=Solanum pennellii TaxID=28526 RepID=A0ABM1H9Z4_SOLPN|nr:protein trichome birefringence-like 42 [Solanum pennellii]
METSSKITQKWMLCAFGSFISCFIFLLYLKHNNEAVNFRALRHAMLNVASSLDDSFSTHGNLEISKPARRGKDEGDIIHKNRRNKCNIFEGRWIYESTESPYYEASQCPFLSEQVSCQKNGRPDFDYENWSWEAHDCVIPSFNGRDMLRRLRGKRIIIVGDSLNRNQWESLACLLYSTIPPSRTHLDFSSGYYKVFKAKDYNVTVEFYWNPFLVQFDSMNAPKILRLEKLDLSSQHWQGADIMVFNTGHWWVHHGKFKAWDLFEYKGRLVDELKLESAFEVAMRTWANWIDQNVNLTKTTVFFRSISPEHKSQNGCYNKTQPITDLSYVTHFSESLTKIVDRTLSKMRVPVRYLNITKLSQHRVDAHPSVYAKKKGQEQIKRKLKTPQSISDCSHWCLPGMPDTWNRLLYASLLLDHPIDSPSLSHWSLENQRRIISSLY